MAFHAEDGILKTDDKGYNARVGTKYGRVGKEDFSIDGKSWEYRNPDNFNDGNDRASEKPTYNKDAYDMTNPLYDYSYGQTRDAAKALGIGNVDEQAEVDQIIDYMQNGSAKEDEEAPVEEIKGDKPKEEEPAAPVAPSQEVTEAKERVQAYDAEMRGNRFDVYGPGNSNFSERSAEIYDPNQDFLINQQSSVSTDGNQQAQLFAQNKLSQVKDKYNFRPTLN